MKRFDENNQSIATVRDLLQRSDIRDEVGLTDVNQILGADRYRLNLLNKAEKNGSLEIEKLIKQ